MRQKVVPLLAPAWRKNRQEDMGSYDTKKRGMAVLTTPLLNKGTAFTVEEREELGLNGLLPPVISTLEAQVTCAYSQYQRLPDALGKNIYLTALHDRNEVLFFRVLSEHLREMIPSSMTAPSASRWSSITTSAAAPGVCISLSITPAASRKPSETWELALAISI